MLRTLWVVRMSRCMLGWMEGRTRGCRSVGLLQRKGTLVVGSLGIRTSAFVEGRTCTG